METVGWREWVSLPELNIPAIKAKLDTGARTSCLHAFEIREYDDGGVPYVAFGMHPVQGRGDVVVSCRAPLVGKRDVRDSGGHREKRYVIETTLIAFGGQWTIEMTLTSRDDMRFRMLLGRTAMRERLVVDSNRSFVFGRNRKTDLARHYPALLDAPKGMS